MTITTTTKLTNRKVKPKFVEP